MARTTNGRGNRFFPRMAQAVARPARNIADRVGEYIPWSQIPDYIQSFLENKEVGRYVSTWLEQNVWKLARHPEKRGLSDEAARHFAKLPYYFYMFAGILMGGRRIDAKSRLIGGSALLYLAQPANLLLPQTLFGPYAAIDDLLVSSIATNSLNAQLGGKQLNQFWMGEGNVVKDAKDMYAFCEATLASLMFRKVEQWLKRTSSPRPRA